MRERKNEQSANGWRPTQYKSRAYWAQQVLGINTDCGAPRSIPLLGWPRNQLCTRKRAHNLEHSRISAGELFVCSLGVQHSVF